MIRRARQDLAFVENLVESMVIADEIFGFDVQQAIEKALKATLTRFGRPYAFTHDLSILYEEVEDLGIELPATLEQGERMTSFDEGGFLWIANALREPGVRSRPAGRGVRDRV